MWLNITALRLSSVSKARSTWIGATETVGLVVEVRTTSHPVRQTGHQLISTCGDPWRTSYIIRNRRHEMNYCSTSWTVLSSSETIAKIYADEHVLFWSEFPCAYPKQVISDIKPLTYVCLSQDVLNMSRISFLWRPTWFNSSVTICVINLGVSLSNLPPPIPSITTS